MSDMTPILGPVPALIPETAPFSPEQRAWLNGFFSGFIALERSTAAAVSTIPLAVPDDGAQGTQGEADDGETPWHDPTLSLAERMALAEGRPLSRRMMAAMAQQDCGQCGYNCQAYAEAIAGKAETRLNLCAPGGKETARMLKTLHAEIEARAKSPAMPVSLRPEDVSGAASGQAAAPGTSRDCPVEIVLLSRRRLNKEGSEKHTWHIEFDLVGSGLSYAVGDSLGVFPQNDPGLVGEVLSELDADPLSPVNGRAAADVLARDVCLGAAPDSLFQLLSYVVGGKLRQKAKALAAGEDPDGDAASLDVLAALQKLEGARPHLEAFIEALNPLQPRLYSISSSPKMAPNRLSLTVDCVRYPNGKRLRLGCASTFLTERLPAGGRLAAYVQKAHNFALPADPATPIIMIGPGTGIAPFRAFLQERLAIGAPGKNWLFFGHQRSDFDFFYKEELSAMKAAGHLTRLSLAWSRDGKDKYYVQDRMRESARDLWAWLEDGAHVYVCGDAKRMAKDVERALLDIACAQGGLGTDEAIGYLAGLKKAKRYQTDVY